MEKLLKIISEHKKASFTGAVIALAILLVSYNSLPFTTMKQQSYPNMTTLHTALKATYDQIPTESGKADFMKQSNNLTTSVDPELVDLDSQIITCATNVDSVISDSHSYDGSCVAAGEGKLSSIKGLYMGGQCCGALTDTKEYHERLQKLQAYKSMPNIPLDPMHTPVEMAKMWIDYDKATTLTPDQQKIYDEAYSMSEEKPCCCKCWHYYTNEGIAKKMIVDGQFNSKQIADFWDASEICGV